MKISCMLLHPLLLPKGPQTELKATIFMDNRRGKKNDQSKRSRWCVCVVCAVRVCGSPSLRLEYMALDRDRPRYAHIA